MVVDDGPIERDITYFSDVFEFTGVCRVYLCGSNFGTDIIIKKGGRTGFHKDGSSALITGFIGQFVYFD
jgi:hypothetical protein